MRSASTLLLIVFLSIGGIAVISLLSRWRELPRAATAALAGEEEKPKLARRQTPAPPRRAPKRFDPLR